MKYIVTFFSILFATFITASALQITEVMYDPKDSITNEWIEFYNDSEEYIDIKNYKIFESKLNRDIKSGQTSTIISPREYFIVAKNLSEFDVGYKDIYSGKIFSSTFGLNNEGEEVKILDGKDGPEITKVSFKVNSGANKTGKTINLIGDNWVVCDSTPGAEASGCDSVDADDNSSNDGNSDASTGGSESGDNNSDTSNSSTKKEIVYVSKRSYSLGDLSILIPKEMDTIAGQNTSFVLQVTNKAKLPTNVYWSYGDGAEGSGASSTHRYKWPGTYTAFIEADTSTAYGIDSIRVTVHHPDLSITEVYNDVSDTATRESNDSYVVIENNGAVDLDIGEFIIATDQGFFPLSRHLLLPAKRSIKLAGETLGFLKATNVRLLFNNKMLVTKFVETPNVFTLSIESDINNINTDTLNSVVAQDIIYQPIVPIKQIVSNIPTPTVRNQPTKLKTFTAQVIVPGTTPPKQVQKISVNTPVISDEKDSNDKEGLSFWGNIFYWLYN